MKRKVIVLSEDKRIGEYYAEMYERKCALSPWVKTGVCLSKNATDAFLKGLRVRSAN